MPDKTAIIKPPQGFNAVYLQTADNFRLYSWYHNQKPIILYFHGNGGSLNERAYRAEIFAKNGFGVFMVSYRGYANSQGEPSEAGFIEDGKAAMKFLTDSGVKPQQIIIYGESIGSGVATQIAAEFSNAKLLVLEAPFSSLLSVAQQKYWFVPVSLLLKDRFDSLAFASKVNVPALVLHAKGDPVIPFFEGQKLFSAFNSPKKMVAVDANFHIDLTPEFIIEQIRLMLKNL